MSCTTYKVCIKDPITENDEYSAYCQALHAKRILNVKPALKFPEVRLTRRTNGGILRFNYNRRVEIAFENQLLLQRMFAVEKRKSLYGNKNTETFNAHERMKANRQYQKQLNKRMAKIILMKENRLIAKRIQNTKSTLNMGKIICEAKRRDLVIMNLSRHRNKMVSPRGQGGIMLRKKLMAKLLRQSKAKYEDPSSYRNKNLIDIKKLRPRPPKRPRNVNAKGAQSARCPPKLEQHRRLRTLSTWSEKSFDGASGVEDSL
eukprot:snap_masked-scaffold_5-processed-gene-1.26-mRNA-1 protein AED:1.00 eAED:1.00 QI:0/-1/0/0/-1/1/1/0/259